MNLDVSAWVASKTPEEIKAILRVVLGPRREDVPASELEQLWLTFALVGVTSTSNNQRTETDVYHVGGVEYWVTYGLADEPIVERIYRED